MSYCTCRLNSQLNFGKYKYQKVSEVMEKDPKYLVWIFKNTSSHPSQEVIDMLKEKGFEVTLIKQAKARLKNKSI